MITEELAQEMGSFSYALFRIAEQIEKQSLKRAIEKRAVALIEAYFEGKNGKFKVESGIIRQLIQLASDLGYVSRGSSAAVAEKLYDFDYALTGGIRGFDAESWLGEKNNKEAEENIKESGEAIWQEEVNSENNNSEDFDFSELEKKEENNNFEEEESVIGDEKMGEELPTSNNELDINSSEIRDRVSKVEKRREEILDKIRREGICFLSDLAQIFPDYSERTLRYDLERLIKDGKVEKIGSSGPGTFYRSTEKMIPPRAGR